jgi:hypothetical protein
MSTQQQAFIVDRFQRYLKDNIDELNSLLKEGWTVIKMSPMSMDHGHTYMLLILEKEI